jgi:hypothetical protein
VRVENGQSELVGNNAFACLENRSFCGICPHDTRRQTAYSDQQLKTFKSHVIYSGKIKRVSGIYTRVPSKIKVAVATFQPSLAFMAFCFVSETYSRDLSPEN